MIERRFGMDSVQETAALIALLRRRDRLWHHYAALVEEAGSATAVLEGNYDEFVPEEATCLFDDSHAPEPVDLSSIVAELVAWRRDGIDVITVLDEQYPANLRTVHNRPPLLFILGSLSDADARSVAVVGSRAASHEGLRDASIIAAGLAEASYTVLSGLAAGVDTAAHRGALNVGGRTVAVIGTGVRKAYPKENAPLQKRLAEESAVVSQFWPDAPPTKTSFPMRNAVMSGMALATVVVEAGPRSGARMQARLALEHGRPVFLCDTLVNANDWAREYVDRPGTYVVESVTDIVETLDRLTVFDTLSL